MPGINSRPGSPLTQFWVSATKETIAEIDICVKSDGFAYRTEWIRAQLLKIVDAHKKKRDKLAKVAAKPRKR